jgi:transcriptional regulator with AAA-type ATPase domain
MSNTRTSNYFTIDFLSKKIIGSSASFKKAGMGTGAWYDELVAKMNAHPDFKLVEVEHKKNPSKTVYDGLDFDFMENYIALQNNAEELLKKMKQVKKCAKKVTNSVYPIVKKWFLDEFGKDFDMEEARKAIKESKEAKILAEAQKEVERASEKAESAEVEDANGLPLRRS